MRSGKITTDDISTLRLHLLEERLREVVTVVPMATRKAYRRALASVQRVEDEQFTEFLERIANWLEKCGISEAELNQRTIHCELSGLVQNPEEIVSSILRKMHTSIQQQIDIGQRSSGPVPTFAELRIWARATDDQATFALHSGDRRKYELAINTK